MSDQKSPGPPNVPPPAEGGPAAPGDGSGSPTKAPRPKPLVLDPPALPLAPPALLAPDTDHGDDEESLAVAAAAAAASPQIYRRTSEELRRRYCMHSPAGQR